MRTIKTVYKIGMGPSSSHTMGPNNAAKQFKALFPNATNYECELYGSLSLTGKGHLTDHAIELELKPITFKWINDELPGHPNAMILKAFDGQKLIGEQTIYSVGGGEIVIVGQEKSSSANEVYPHNSFGEIKAYCRLNNINLIDYVKRFENWDEVHAHMQNVWNAMKSSVEKGLAAEGVLPGDLKLNRKAKKIFEMEVPGESDYTRQERLVSAYAFAVNEENAGGGTIVTAPTCGASGTLPAAFYHMQKYKNLSDEAMIEALVVAGIIGNITRTNASVSGAEAGCQAEVGTATAMAAAGIAQLYGEDIDVIEHAAKIAFEHQLGLTCDPIGGYVQVPCIERNAVAAARAMQAYRLSRYTSEDQLITLDQIIATMFETGKDMKVEYRETSLGGMAKLKIEKKECTGIC